MGEYTREEWLARRNNGGSMRKFLKSRERMVHKSTEIIHVPNPLFNPDMPVSNLNLMTLPKVQSLGRAGTYNVGRNKSKAENRRADICQRVLSRKVHAVV